MNLSHHSLGDFWISSENTIKGPNTYWLLLNDWLNKEQIYMFTQDEIQKKIWISLEKYINLTE